MKKQIIFTLLTLSLIHTSLSAQTGDAAAIAATQAQAAVEEPAPKTLAEEEKEATASLPAAQKQGDMNWKNWAFIGSALALALVGCSVVSMNKGHTTD